MIPILLGVIVIVFTLMYITPGDTATILLGDSATPEAVAALNEKLGLDQPYVVQLYRYVRDIVIHLDLGTSYRTKQPVLNEILARLPNTLKLASLADRKSVV
jgi:peptide/nickel transport system permease protein